jgi:quercetin dioxygenase-like cupin family protein
MFMRNLHRLSSRYLGVPRDVTSLGSPTAREVNVQKISLTALAREHLKMAMQAPAGRSAHSVYGCHEHVLRQTLIALQAGQRLDEHENPGEATLQVLLGRVRLASPTAAWDGCTGDHLIIPDDRHSVEALEDSVVLLTVAKLP